MSGGRPAGDVTEPPAARLTRLRTTLGLSQEQLARELGVSFATVNRWETGHTQMSARAVRALAEFEARHAAAPAAAPHRAVTDRATTDRATTDSADAHSALYPGGHTFTPLEAHLAQMLTYAGQNLRS